jgi:hypothetical protein
METIDHGVIELRLRDVAQLFNSFDPSPFPEKDLDADAEDFIVSWAMEHHKHAPLSLRVYLANAPRDVDAAASIEQGVHSYFQHKAELTQRKFKQLLARGRWSLLIGVAVLAASIVGADLLEMRVGDGAMFQLFRESILIGGWVAMWRPMEIFLYDWWPVRHERRVYERLSRAPVQTILPS